MVDTLAPKKIFSQRDLDKSLVQPTPVGSSIMAPSTNVLDASPNIETQKSLSETPQPDYVVDKNQVFNMMQNIQKQSRSMVAETNETVKSSEELTKEKQVGERAERETPQGEGLVMRPVEYAAKGVKDKEVSGPILVGEKGAELIVPTGEGKVSILDAKTTNGLMMSGSTRAEAVKEMTSDDAYTAFNIKNFLLKGRDDDAKKNLEKFIDVVHNIESSRGKNLSNKSSAAGHFQFKTRDNLDKKGNVILDKNGNPKKSSFETGLQRVENLYTAKGQPVPYWVDEARQHKDPNKLSYTQQEELFLINLQQQVGTYKGETDQLINDVMQGNAQAAKELYGRFHHTNTKVLNNERIQNIFDNAYGSAKVRNPSIVTRPIRKAEKGAENVDIGRAEPAGFLFRSPATPDKPSGLEGILNFLLPKGERPPVGGAPEPRTESIVHRPTEDLDKEPFDLEKLKDQDSPYGINIDYFYDNYRDTMPEYTIKMRKGQDYIPTREEIEKESEDLYNRYRAFFDMTSLEYDDEDFEDAKRRYMDRDPYDDADKRRQDLVEEFGPKILPEA